MPSYPVCFLNESFEKRYAVPLLPAVGHLSLLPRSQGMNFPASNASSSANRLFPTSIVRPPFNASRMRLRD
jgi:hypothetical protein